ncbi:origin of replication complex subunit 4 isoform X5 [Malania oleifera]|uniref:origin of replication complex subunit 4 isoform X5 n=1 Tax=Malania oleifera TaxID=397392 RepID=UPI0025AE0DF7|nr:origin of replication complex subunit 4 isoform X5 [Malania oleifera]
MVRENHAEKALTFLRSRLCNPSYVFRPLSDSPDSNYSKLKFIISSSVTETCNNSILLLGPRGSGKIAVLELVLTDLLQEYPEMISVIRLNGYLHSDDNCALKGKQRLLYSLLDAMQSVTSQAVVIGISCRLDADQLLEKRVRSRFSHRKLLFLPPSEDDLQRLLDHILSLPTDSSLPKDYAVKFNANIHNLLADERFKEILRTLSNFDSSVSHLLRFLFCAVSFMDLESGFLSLENFKTALSSVQRQPKLESLQDCSVLELYILVCMKKLEVKEQNSYNFISVMKEYKAIHDSYQTCDFYAETVCLRAFEHLLQRELICYVGNVGRNQSIEFCPVKLLISANELHHGLKSNRCCPAILQKLVDREN